MRSALLGFNAAEPAAKLARTCLLENLDSGTVGIHHHLARSILFFEDGNDSDAYFVERWFGRHFCSMCYVVISRTGVLAVKLLLELVILELQSPTILRNCPYSRLVDALGC